jgi:hypothetical protein
MWKGTTYIKKKSGKKKYLLHRKPRAHTKGIGDAVSHPKTKGRRGRQCHVASQVCHVCGGEECAERVRVPVCITSPVLETAEGNLKLKGEDVLDNMHAYGRVA